MADAGGQSKVGTVGTVGMTSCSNQTYALDIQTPAEKVFGSLKYT